ncbi:SpaA isopeptide-forming pilin-related protein [Flavonifractor plautii]|uniref:SpaA isopeptide-forming pilin-related protein n=14 Tax=Flavonifractor plautii TaxID=292800 RepID=A0AAW6C4P8_FLAPL|nr:SpaA isopeptide-forming pilin-related protein [Flavonifractor plautii]MDB7888687.1 SpaA isopeptide-forming pilin-related protein [Flavonifractor plautii]MDB7906054.1 SpaA isopeptide-forming pilin-related protein [Flavonifractor plautii]
MKRIISLMLTLAVTLSLLVLLAGAASTPEEALGEVNIYSGGYSMKYLAVNGKVQTQSYTYFLYENSAGETQEIPAYCVNPNQYGVPQTVPEGESIRYLAEEKASDPKVVGLIANMYPHRSLEELGLDNKYQAFYAGKIALWCYLIPEWDISAVTVAPGLTGTEREIGENILNAAVQIYTEGTRWTSVAEPQLTTSPDQETAYPVTIDGAAYRQQVFTVTSPTWVDGQAVNVSFQDGTDVPEGARIADENNQDITQVKVSNTGDGYKGTFKVLYPEDSVAGQSGSVQLSLSADVYQYVVFYALCQEVDQYGNLQSYLCDTDPKVSLLRNAISNYSDTDEPDAPDEPTPPPSETALKITKYEAGTTVTLSGATFEVVGPDGDTIGIYTTPESGSIAIPLTEVGNYTIYERVPPEYHLLDEEPVKQVTVKYGETAEVDFENEPYGDLRIEKIDGATGASLAGAKVQIKHIESGATYTGITGTGGSYTFTKLKPGAYEIRELSAPEGWQRDPQTYTTTVVAGDCVTYTLKNEALPGLKIIKYDRLSHETMPGVTFRIWRDGELLGDYETDALGEILLTDCRPGTYRVQEVDTGDSGHLVDSTPQEIELKAGDSIKELYFFNDQKPGIWLVKVDSADPSKVIPNARFRIEAVDGNFGPAEFTTDQNGEIDLSELPTGAYVVTELECPGYIIDEAQRIIQMEANQTARFVFTNSVKPSLHLIKLSADGSRLAGVTFRIAKIEDGSRYLDRTTDENGEILISGLEPGVYSVKELDTTSDHIIDPVERHVELFPGKTSTIILENDIRPNLTVVKRDADTGAPVAGAVFTVKAADGHSVDEIKTGADGTATLENLLPGVYEVTEKSVPAPYLLDAPSQLVTLYPNRNHTVYFENHKKPILTIQKVDSITGNPIKGAKFQIWYASNSTDTGELNDLGTYFTDASGQIVLEGLRDGWYRVTELEPAPGFTIKEPATQEVYIEGGGNKSLTFENVPLNAIVVHKTDSVTGEALGGATFQLRYLGGTSGTCGTMIGQKVTGSNGMAIWTGLKPGSYIVEEVDPADGYSIIQSSETVYLADNGEQSVITVRFENMPDGNLLIRKVCATNPSETLPDAEFKITYADGTLIGDSNGIYRTDENGEILISGLQPGKSVVVTETQAPPGYLIDTQAQTVQIKEGRTVSLNFKNQPKGELIIQKRDSATGQPLAGAQFRVTTAAGCEVGLDGVIGDSTLTQNGIFTTDSSGEIRITNLAPGAYVLTEIKAPHGYVMDAPSTNVVIGEGGDTQTVVITNTPKGGLVINKLDSVTHEPLEGVEFTITEADGTVVDDNGGMTSSMGLYRTDENGQIMIDGLVGTFLVTETKTIEGYTIHEETRTQTVVINPNDTQTITVYNDPIGGVEIIKVNADDTRERIPNTTFEIRRMDDALVDTVTTDKNGRVFLALENGSYYAVETESAEGFKLDDTPHYFEVKNGETTVLQVENTPVSAILIHKTDSTTGEGIYGVPFILYDSTNTPVGQYTSNNEGYVLIEGLEAGRYYLRELENEGYVPDTEKKTVYVESGETTEVEWENTPITGQIQITKTSADYNSVNGWPAGTPIPGTEFEIYNARTGNLVDTVETDKNGVASSRPLPLGRYKIVESKAADFYGLDKTPIEVEIEFAGQIVKVAMTNKSLYTNVSIQKTGYVEVMPGQQIRYDFSGIGNNSTTSLTSFFWRDTLPGQAVRLDKIVTGTYNVPGNYKVVYKTNLSGGTWRTLADNLSTQQNYVLDASKAALCLASNEYVTEFMMSFGVVPANFRQVEAPQVYATVYAWLTGGSQFVNQADVGGVYNGQWIMATSRWVTKVYKPSEPLPRTGY